MWLNFGNVSLCCLSQSHCIFSSSPKTSYGRRNTISLELLLSIPHSHSCLIKTRLFGISQNTSPQISTLVLCMLWVEILNRKPVRIQQWSSSLSTDLIGQIQIFQVGAKSFGSFLFNFWQRSLWTHAFNTSEMWHQELCAKGSKMQHCKRISEPYVQKSSYFERRKASGNYQCIPSLKKVCASAASEKKPQLCLVNELRTFHLQNRRHLTSWNAIMLLN